MVLGIYIYVNYIIIKINRNKKKKFLDSRIIFSNNTKILSVVTQ